MKPRIQPMLLALLLLGVAACGEKDPVEEIHKARQQFSEVHFVGSVPDKDKGRLLVQIILKKDGKRSLDTLTLKVIQKNAKGGELRVDHVSLDVSTFRDYEGREISFQVPLGDGVAQLSFDVETALTPGVEYPEFNGVASE